MKAIVLGLLVATVGTACLPPAGRQFHTTLIAPNGEYSLPVTLGDETDLVVMIEPAEIDDPGGLQPTLRADPDDPNAFIVAWLGGACDNDAALSLRPTGPGYVLHLEVHGQLVFGCTALGISRAVRIKASEAIPLDAITTTGSG
ncbi:MAG TPA: hypothetical protein VMQ65_04845 [Candidatus Limnocylindria bacterium]|nr:hypothetical protein [Candidatus Limnocylindria bacterium]